MTREAADLYPTDVEARAPSSGQRGASGQLSKDKLVVNTFLSEHVTLYPGEERQDLTIELAYQRSSASKYADPSTLNWFQTFRTNYIPSSEEGQPYPDEGIKDYVDGPSGPDKQTAVFTNTVNGSVFSDQPHRKALRDRDVYWKAETSVIGILPAGVERLASAEWGLMLNRQGAGRTIPLRLDIMPSGYHLAKIQELPKK